MNERIAHLLRTVREAKGWTQVELALHLGVSQPTVHRWERGQIRPQDSHVKRLVRIAADAGVDCRMAGDPLDWSLWTAGQVVPLVGRVTAGGRVDLFDRKADAEPASASAPAGIATGTLAALVIEGEALLPLKAGWLLFYDTRPALPPSAFLDKLCIVHLTEGGPLLVRELHRGYRTKRFNLTCWTAAPTEDADIAWASPVVDIRPV